MGFAAALVDGLRSDLEGRMIVPPRTTPPIVRPEFPEAIGLRRHGPAQPNVWPGMRVLLLGVPRASFLERTAAMTLPGGSVTVMVIDRRELQRLRKRTAPEGMEHLTFKAARSDRVPLPDQSADRAFLPAEMTRDETVRGILLEIARVLDPDGKLIVYEHGLGAGILRPRHTRILCEDAGLELVTRTGGWLRRALVFRSHTGQARGRNTR